jgi:hypothetical protein
MELCSCTAGALSSRGPTPARVRAAYPLLTVPPPLPAHLFLPVACAHLTSPRERISECAGRVHAAVQELYHAPTYIGALSPRLHPLRTAIAWSAER